MRVRLNNICMCTGDIYESAETEIDDDFLTNFLKLSYPDTDIYINPDAIISFQVSPELHIVK